MEVLSPSWPQAIALIGAAVIGIFAPLVSQGGAAAVAFLLASAASLSGHLPRLVHASGASHTAAVVAAVPALAAVAALVHSVHPDLRRTRVSWAALGGGMVAPMVFYVVGGPLVLLPPAAFVAAAAAGLTLVRARPVMVLGIISAVAIASLAPLRPGLGGLLAWRLEAAAPAFERDGRRQPVVLSEGDLWVGARLRERRAGGERVAPASFVQAALPLALRSGARRVLMIDLLPATLEVVARAPLERIDVVESEPAVMDAARFLHVPMDDSRIHVASRVPPARERWDIAISRSPEPLRGIPADLRVIALALGDLDEKQLRAALGAAVDLAPHLLLVLPDEQTLVVLASDQPMALDPQEIVGMLARKELAPLAAGAGIHGFTDILALVAGDEQLARTLAHESAGNHRATALAAILGAHADNAAPNPSALPAGEMAAWASRVVEGAARGELPGWRGPAALAAAQASLSPAARARLSALLLLAEGRDDEAAGRLDEALRLAPDDVDAARERGRLLLDHGETDAARVPLARVFARTSAPADRLLLSEALVADGDPTARLHLEELVRAGIVRAHLWLGRLDQREGRPADAEKELLAFARATPDDDEVFYELGALVWRDKKRATDARGWFEQGARNSTRAAASDLRRGLRRLDAADPLGALVFLRRAAAHDRLAPGPRRGLARAYAALGRRQAAQKALDEYLDIVGRASRDARSLIEELGR